VIIGGEFSFLDREIPREPVIELFKKLVDARPLPLHGSSSSEWRAVISRIGAEKHRPSIEAMERIAKGLEVSVRI
jgi:hypothetical protein